MDKKINNYLGLLNNDLAKIKDEIEKLSILQIKTMGKIEVLNQLKEDLESTQTKK